MRTLFALVSYCIGQCGSSSGPIGTVALYESQERCEFAAAYLNKGGIVSAVNGPDGKPTYRYWHKCNMASFQAALPAELVK